MYISCVDQEGKGQEVGTPPPPPEKSQRYIEPVRDKTNKMDQNMDFHVLVFFDRMDNPF